MNRWLKISLVAVLLSVACYYAWLFALPAITIVNVSGGLITQAKITLPSNKLDFGGLKDTQENTLYYQLKQDKDGEYVYQIDIQNGENLAGSCGYVTNNELNKRVIIYVHSTHVVCQTS